MLANKYDTWCSVCRARMPEGTGFVEKIRDRWTPFCPECVKSSNGGSPPLLLDPVDFVSLYRQKAAQQPQAAPASSA